MEYFTESLSYQEKVNMRSLIELLVKLYKQDKTEEEIEEIVETHAELRNFQWLPKSTTFGVDYAIYTNDTTLYPEKSFITESVLYRLLTKEFIELNKLISKLDEEFLTRYKNEIEYLTKKNEINIISQYKFEELNNEQELIKITRLETFIEYFITGLELVLIKYEFDIPDPKQDEESIKEDGIRYIKAYEIKDLYANTTKNKIDYKI